MKSFAIIHNHKQWKVSYGEHTYWKLGSAWYKLSEDHKSMQLVTTEERSAIEAHFSKRLKHSIQCMTDQEILAELNNNNGKTIVVDNTWYFTGKAMGCSNSADFACCDDYFDTFEEALECIRSFGGKVEKL